VKLFNALKGGFSMRALLCSILIVTLALVGCAGGTKTNTIKIGWIGPLTGDTAAWGEAELNTVKMMVEDYNLQGGIEVGGKRYKLEVIGYDDKGDGVEAVNAAVRLTSQDKVAAVIGPQGSGEAIPLAATMNKNKVPLVATTATNPKVTVAEDTQQVHPYMFRDCFLDPYQGKVAATFAYKNLGKRNAAIFMAIDDPYSTGLAEFFKLEFEKLGGKVVESVSFTSGEKEFRAPLTKIKAANPDIIFSPNYYTEVALSAKQARELGITAVMLGGDGWPSDNLITLAGSALEGSWCINHLDPDGSSAKALYDSYKAKFNKNPELNTFMAHDAMLMVVDAIQRAKSFDGEKIAKALESCDIQGITGRIKIGPTHDPIGKTAWMLQVVGPKLVFKEKMEVLD
jgi:branched-chain amino acid transport system substrate-binding protein